MSEGVRGSSQGLRETEAPVSFLGRQRLQSGSEGVRGSSQVLRETEAPVSFLGRQRLQSGSEGVRGSSQGWGSQRVQPGIRESESPASV